MFPAILIQLIIAAIVIGLVLWLIGFLPIDARIKQIITVIVIVIVVIWAIYLLLGFMPGSAGYPLRR